MAWRRTVLLLLVWSCSHGVHVRRLQLDVCEL